MEYIEKTNDGRTVWRGHKNFEELLLPIDKLTLHPNNARRNHDVSGICASLREHGQQDVVKFTPNGEVIAGNGRLKAARELGWEYLAANEFTADDLRAINYAIADNRLGESSDWDYETLSGQLSALIDADFDPLTFGWEQHQLDMILAADWTPVEIADLGEFGQPAEHLIRLTDDGYEILQQAKNQASERDNESYTDAETIVLIAQEWRVGK